MQLPGGLIEGNALQRQWSFQPVSGRLELALAEAAEQVVSAPQAVTRVLALALAQLGDRAATEDRTAALCVADRQFLMRELDRHLGGGGGWFHADCSACAARFDFHLDYAELPVRAAGPSYPLARVERDGRLLSFRLPTGADQEEVARIADENVRPWLLRRLSLEPEQLGEIDEALLAQADAALEAVAPVMINQIQTECPECGAANSVDLDPYRVLARRSDDLLRQVHQIATHYHWSEAEILAMPRMRRQRYLDLIDRARGMGA
jgi:hypothetical protein